jgi:hypothetical protein
LGVNGFSFVLLAVSRGFYMGGFNFFIVLPQILAAVALGRLVDAWLGGDAMKAVLVGGAIRLEWPRWRP